MISKFVGRKEDATMYDVKLETFIVVADCGSFNKAAEELHITAPAVIKQMNLLESELDLKLFVRTHRGLMLTEAGKSIYQDSKYMIQYSRDSIRRARRAMRSQEAVVRIGTSFMTPSQFLVELWPKIHEYDPELKFQLVPFDNTPENAREILSNLGRHIDVVAGIYDEYMLEYSGSKALEMWKEPFCCAVPIHHPMATKKRLRLEDLQGERLMVIHRGWMKEVDRLREELQERHPSIEQVEFDFYDVSVFNQCANSDHILLSVGKWEYVHPLTKIMPVEWDYEAPYGLFHAPEPSPQVRRLLDAVRKTLIEPKPEKVD